MRIVGHGIDLVEVVRIKRMLNEHGERFLERCFTAAEQEYSLSSAARAAEHLAARFAAKEAVLKALGTGWSGGIAWTDVEVVREADGRPRVVLTGEALRLAQQMRITEWWLSLTHSGGYASASVIAVGD